MKRNTLRCFSLLLLLVTCSAAAAWADDLNVSLTTDCHSNGGCFLDQGIGGLAASGNASFMGTPWTYEFLTANPISWNETMHGYTAGFGPGGSFGMTGPDNLFFVGQITSGSEYAHFDHDYLFETFLNFTGKWSNNVEASGYVTLSGIVNSVTFGSLDTYTVPEPTNLALLGSGIVGLWGTYRRRPRA